MKFFIVGALPASGKRPPQGLALEGKRRAAREERTHGHPGPERLLSGIVALHHRG